jgi:hypothetical protein
VGPSRCAETGRCLDIAAGFEGLDLTTLCASTPDPRIPGVVTVEERRFDAKLRQEAVACTRRLDRFACIVTCRHPVEGETEAGLLRRFESHLAFARDSYGAERSASIQGVAAFPRRAHTWRSGSRMLELELDWSHGCEPFGWAECKAFFRTRYTRLAR